MTVFDPFFGSILLLLVIHRDKIRLTILYICFPALIYVAVWGSVDNLLILVYDFSTVINV